MVEALAGFGALDVAVLRDDAEHRVAEITVDGNGDGDCRILLAADSTAPSGAGLRPASDVAFLPTPALVAERERVARDLHDGVVQSVFAISLSLASLAMASPEPVRAAIEDSIDHLDGIVRQVRSTVFDLRRRQAETLSARVVKEVADSARATDLAPIVTISDGLDDVLHSSEMPGVLGDHAVLVLREALSNVSRHARATHVWVEVCGANDTLRLVVTDDGVGIDPTAPSGDGLVNFRQRAAALSGACAIGSRSGGGTVMTWTVPICSVEPTSSHTT